jgi:hypothetical protein
MLHPARADQVRTDSVDHHDRGVASCPAFVAARTPGQREVPKTLTSIGAAARGRKAVDDRARPPRRRVVDEHMTRPACGGGLREPARLVGDVVGTRPRSGASSPRRPAPSTTGGRPAPRRPRPAPERDRTSHAGPDARHDPARPLSSPLVSLRAVPARVRCAPAGLPDNGTCSTPSRARQPNWRGPSRLQPRRPVRDRRERS